MMTRRCAPALLGALGVVFALAAHGARAETPSAGPQWLRAPRERGPLAGSLAFDGRTSWGLDAAIPLGRLMTGATASAPRLGLGVSVAGRGMDGTTGDLRFAALMDRRLSRTGAWLGAAGAGSGAPGGRLHIGVGLWRSFAPVDLEAGLVTSAVQTLRREAVTSRYAADTLVMRWRDTVTVHDVERGSLWSTAQGALRWRRGRLELGTIGGVTVGQGTPMQHWAQATLHLQSSPRVLLLASYGQRPAASLAFDPTARPRTMVGVQLALWASPEWAMAGALTPSLRDWRIRRMPDGRLIAWLRCRNAHLVELTGDLTDWTPVRLTALEGGWWSASFPVEPGLHQVQVRLDNGPWQVPPGLPHTQGAFAGDAGVVVVE